MKLSLFFYSILLFSLSTLFPIVASVLPTGAAPLWVGAADVLIALLVVIVQGYIVVKLRSKVDDAVKVASFKLYHSFASVPLLLLILFFLWGEKIHWEILLPGLAWRAWVLLYSIPFWVALKQSG